jgi:tRNA-dihydrouridine synthase
MERPIVGINEMRRHYTNYLKGLPGIKEFRYKLVTLTTPEAINEVLDEIAEHYKQHEFVHTPIEIINYHEKCPL